LTVLTLHPIIAALAAIATIVLGISTYFGFASNGADDFAKKLDGVNMPARRTSAPLRQQAMDVQNQLQAASTGGRLAGPVGAQASQTANRESVDNLGTIAKLSAQQLETLKLILQVLKISAGPAGLLVGGF
jgi:hypothetical protein